MVRIFETRYLCAAVVAGVFAESAPSQFVEPEVEVLYTLIGETAGSAFGFVSSEVADIDGDGASEIIVGAPGHGGNGPGSGRAYVFSGATGDLIAHLVVTGETTQNLGSAVDDAGDVNGDGTTDLIAGAPGAPFGTSTNPGRVVVFSGVDGSILWERSGENPGDHFGIDVAGIRADVDGDGLVDVLVGADLFSPGVTGAGRVYVLSGADGSVIQTMDGTTTNAHLGNGVGRVGDVNGDGEVEIVAAARNSGRSPKGRAFVYTASSGAIVHTLVPNPTSASFGYFFTTGVGDVDGDSVPDVYVPDFGDYAVGSAAGRAYVFSGASGEKIREWEGELAGEGFGIGRGAGDVDGDGHEDMLLCSWTSSFGAPNAGKGYVYSGRDSSLIREMTCNVAGDTVGYDANAMGDVNGDGAIDFALTAPGNGPGRVYVVAGIADGCYPDCDQTTGAGVLDVFDFLCFQNEFVGGGAYACECDVSTGPGVCDVFDFLCFQDTFVGGCR